QKLTHRLTEPTPAPGRESGTLRHGRSTAGSQRAQRAQDPPGPELGTGDRPHDLPVDAAPAGDVEGSCAVAEEHRGREDLHLVDEIELEGLARDVRADDL